MTRIAVAVVLHRGHVLVGRRGIDAVDGAGFDEFPGGKVEAGESPAAAAERECLEEAGIAVRVGDLLDRTVGAAQSGPLDVLFFAAAPLDDRAEPTPPFAWVPVADLAVRRFPAANAGVLALLAHGGS